MMELLRDGAGQFADTLFAIVGIGAIFLVYLLQKERKELAFGVFYTTHLLGVSQELASRVHVSFDAKPISNLRLLVLAIKNSGNRPIDVSDFEYPPSVLFGDTETPLSVEVTHQVPENLGAKIELQADRLSISKLLLNQGDYFIFKVLTTGKPGNPRLDARVKGVPKLASIRHFNDMHGRHKVRQNMVMLPIMSLAFGAIVYFSMPLFVSNLKTLLAFFFFLALFSIMPFIQWLIEYLNNETNRFVDENNDSDFFNWRL